MQLPFNEKILTCSSKTVALCYILTFFLCTIYIRLLISHKFCTKFCENSIERRFILPLYYKVLVSHVFYKLSVRWASAKSFPNLPWNIGPLSHSYGSCPSLRNTTLHGIRVVIITKKWNYVLVWTLHRRWDSAWKDRKICVNIAC